MSHAEASLLRAEERSAAAMLTAEGAVLDEMEVSWGQAGMGHGCAAPESENGGVLLLGDVHGP